MQAAQECSTPFAKRECGKGRAHAAGHTALPNCQRSAAMDSPRPDQVFFFRNRPLLPGGAFLACRCPKDSSMSFLPSARVHFGTYPSSSLAASHLNTLLVVARAILVLVKSDGGDFGRTSRLMGCTMNSTMHAIRKIRSQGSLREGR